MRNQITRNAALVVRSLLGVAALLGLMLAAPASAGDQPKIKTLWEQQVGQWSDPRTAPEARTRCKSTTDGVWPGGGKWKVCKEWRTEARVMEIHPTLSVHGPKGLNKVETGQVEKCSRFAAVAAAQATDTDPTTADGAAKSKFAACASDAGLAFPDRFTVSVETRSNWSDWH